MSYQSNNIFTGEVCFAHGIDGDAPWERSELLARYDGSLEQPDLLAAVVDGARHARTDAERALANKALGYYRWAMQCDLAVQRGYRGGDGPFSILAAANRRDMAIGILRSVLKELHGLIRSHQANKDAIDVEFIDHDDDFSAGAAGLR